MSLFIAPVGEHVGNGQQLRGIELQRILRQLGGVLLQLGQGGQGAARNGGVAEGGRGADSVEPGGGVGVVLFGAVRVELDGLIQGVGDVAVRNKVGGLRMGHLDGGAQNDAGEAHAAHGRPEETAFGVVGGTLRLQVQHAAVSNQQFHTAHMVAEGAGAMVVLAVDVRADGATNGDLAGAGEDRNPEAVRQCCFHQLVEGDTASTSTMPVSGSMQWMVLRGLISMTRPPALAAGSP